MITTTILAIVESFLATLAYAILFNVPKQYYTACGITGMAGWLLYLAMCQVTTVALASFDRNIGSSIDFQDFDGTEKMPDYDIFGFRNYSTCSGSWNILYSILPCDRSDVTGCCEGIRGSAKLHLPLYWELFLLYQFQEMYSRFVTGEQRESGKG